MSGSFAITRRYLTCSGVPLHSADTQHWNLHQSVLTTSMTFFFFFIPRATRKKNEKKTAIGFGKKQGE